MLDRGLPSSERQLRLSFGARALSVPCRWLEDGPCSRRNNSVVPFEATQFGRLPGPVQACKDWGRAFSKQSILRKPGAARRARMLCGHFPAISLQSLLSIADDQRGVP